MDQRITALETNEKVNHGRICTMEIALWGDKRDGDGGIVNKLNSTITKVALLTGLTSFAGSAVGMIIISHLAAKAGLKQ